MKRVKAACLYQTICFILDPSVEKEIALEKVKNEVSVYKANLGTHIQLLKEVINNDGSVELEVRKSVSGYSVGKYFD